MPGSGERGGAEGQTGEEEYAALRTRRRDHSRFPPIQGKAPPPVGLWSNDKCDDAALMMGSGHTQRERELQVGYYVNNVCIPFKQCT